MSSKTKHALRSHRGYRNSRSIPHFQEFYSRKKISDLRSFDRSKTSFAEHMAKMFAMLSLKSRKRG